MRIALLVTAAVVMVIAAWATAAAAARRLPPGPLRELVGLLPNIATMLRRLVRDPRVPRRVKVAVGLSLVYVVSPIDLIPEFVPVVGPLDDAVVVALVLRFAARRVPAEALADAWPGDPATLGRLIGRP